MFIKSNLTTRIIYSAMVLAAQFAFAVPACAEQGAELFMPNDAEGHVYLTLEACNLTTNAPEGTELHRAYSVALEGTDKEQKFEGCWTSPKLDVSTIPAEYVHKAERAVVIFAENGMMVNQLLSDFKPRTPEAAVAGLF